MIYDVPFILIKFHEVGDPSVINLNKDNLLNVKKFINIILIYQLNVVNNCYNIFLAFYYNYVQRDRLVNLHSAIISGYYYFANLVDYSEYIPINKYQKYIVDNAQKFSESFHTFYQNYIN